MGLIKYKDRVPLVVAERKEDDKIIKKTERD